MRNKCEYYQKRFSSTRSKNNSLQKIVRKKLKEENKRKDPVMLLQKTYCTSDGLVTLIIHSNLLTTLGFSENEVLQTGKNLNEKD